MRTRDRVLGLLFLLTIVTYVDRVCIGTMAGEISRDLGLSPRQMGTVNSRLPESLKHFHYFLFQALSTIRSHQYPGR